eukprot:CAMPEP_0113635672 /NCGR_PEP_ID=MMETSP0017_2-20120614/18597_1 /TAXON_ID=2856 /ORGANISM="Cylindrotheca closterium" /LENGTH=887 /DNA_ID=CAMNT_0000546467 /DNA_START=81 /DNA_END=2741 /DNA_ORIENTATION=+ /assembly_acc=CAM_ASM_000147
MERGTYLTAVNATRLSSLEAQFESFRLSTLAEMDNLKNEVSRLTMKLEESESRHSSYRANESSSQQQQQQQESKVEMDEENKESEKEDHSWWKKGPEKVESITYQKAWEFLGGDSELAKHVDRFRNIQDMVVDDTIESEIKLLLPRHYSDRKSYSTALVNQNYVRSLEELYQQANNIYSEFDIAVNSLAKATGGRAVVPPVKGEVRARMKALFKYRDDRDEDDDDDMNNNVAWYRLTDLVRGTLEYDTMKDLYAGLEALIEHFGRDNVLEVNDRYQNPMTGGYRDVQCSIKFQDHVCELQLNTEPMLRAKMTTGHRDFEVIRELKAAVVSGDLLRVMNSLEFGRDHLGTDCLDNSNGGNDQLSPLARLIRSKSANTLLHEAASKGDANIMHALLMYGADPDVQNTDGETALHVAVFGGHEPCVWVLLNVGKASLTIKNNEGQTALVKGYLLTWTHPTEFAIRAVTTLAHRAGADAVREARNTVQVHVQKMQYNSSQLVDYAENGRIDEMKKELRKFADPNSTRGGRSALLKAILNYQFDAVKLLLEFNARADLNIFMNLPLQQFRMDQKLQKIVSYLCEQEKIPHVRVTKGFWSKGIISMIPLEEGVCYQSDREYVLENVPYELQGIPTTLNPCHTRQGLELSIMSYGKTIGVLIAHGAMGDYGEETIDEFCRQLVDLGFVKTTLRSIYSSSFGTNGADLWQLLPPVPSTNETSTDEMDSSSSLIVLTVRNDLELNICLLPKPISVEFEIMAIDGYWMRKDGKNSLLKITRLRENAQQYSDREYEWMGVPLELQNIPMTVNPCHSRDGLKVQISNLSNSSDASFGILIGRGARDEYGSNYESFCKTLQDEGYTKTEFLEMYSTSYPEDHGAELWTLPIKASSTAIVW